METKTPNLTERINLMYRYAIQKGYVSSKTEFASFLEIQPATLSRYFAGAKEPSTNTLRRFNVLFGQAFNEQWLLLGTGEMLANADATPACRQEPTEPPMGQEPISAIAMLIDEMKAQRESRDAQINELLTIINNLTKN